MNFLAIDFGSPLYFSKQFAVIAASEYRKRKGICYHTSACTLKI